MVKLQVNREKFTFLFYFNQNKYIVTSENKQKYLKTLVYISITKIHLYILAIFEIKACTTV